MAVGGIVIGEKRALPPTVWRYQWPPDIVEAVITSENPNGSITNSDLECAGLLLEWLVIMAVSGHDPKETLEEAHVALFSDNSPTVHWVRKLASKGSWVALQLLRALAFCLQQKKVSPLTPLHISGVANAMTDIPSQSFGSVPQWHCKSDTDLRLLFNSLFPLPKQASWTVFRLSSEACMKVISILQMKPSTMEEWRRLPPIGKFSGPIGPSMSYLWDWTLTYRTPLLNTASEHCQVSVQESEQDSTVEDAKLELAQYQALSRPLARRLQWPRGATQQN